MRSAINEKTTSRSFEPQNAAVFIALFSLILSSCSSYRSEISWPAVENELTTHYTVPIYKLHKLILIKGEADGTSGYFIFDTGAPCLVLNETHFKDYHTDPTRQATGVNGIIRDVRIRSVANLKLKELSFKHQMADVMDLSHIERKRNVKILGLLGINLFKGEELEIDLQHQVLRIFRIDQNGTRLHKQGPVPQSGIISMPFTYKGAFIQLEARINHRSYNLLFDSGSEVLLLDKSILDQDSIYTKPVSSQKLFSTDGYRSDLEIRQLNQIKIGLNLSEVKMLATDLKKLRAFGFRADGLIGYDLMASGIITINFNKRILQIKPYTKT